MKKAILFILILVLVCCVALAMLEFLKDFEVSPVITETSGFSTDVPDTTSPHESDVQTNETTEAAVITDEETTESSAPDTTEPEIVTEPQTTETSAPVEYPESLDNVPDPYRSVLNNKSSFVIERSGNTVAILLDEYSFPYSLTPITQTNVEYAVLDMDGDGEVEVVLTGAYGDMLVLHNVNGAVYGFDFTFKNMYYVKTDGTFSWNGMEQDRLAYGISKLYFEGTSCQQIKLCHVEDDGTDKFVYYIGNQSVTEAEYDTFAATLGQKEIAWYTLEGYPKVNPGG